VGKGDNKEPQSRRLKPGVLTGVNKRERIGYFSPMAAWKKKRGLLPVKYGHRQYIKSTFPTPRPMIVLVPEGAKRKK